MNAHSKKPLLSILIPTYNYATYVGEAVESVLAQTFNDFEVVIVDDASTDHTEEVCRRVVDLDSRVRFFRNSRNLGMVENWNYSMTLARGDYVKLLLADDKLHCGDALSLQVGALEKDSRASLVCSSRAIIDHSSRVVEVCAPLGAVDRRVKLGEIEKYMVRRAGRGMNFIGEPSAVMFRRQDVGVGFSANFRQSVDLEMWLRLMEFGDLQYIAKPLCAFRVHPLQQSSVNRTSGVGELEELNLVRVHFRDRPGGRRRIALVERIVVKLWKCSAKECLRAESEAIGQRESIWLLGLATFIFRVWRIQENLSRVRKGQSKHLPRWLRYVLSGARS